MEFKDNLNKFRLNLNAFGLRLETFWLKSKGALEVIFGIIASSFLIFLALILFSYKIFGDAEIAFISAILLMLLPFVGIFIIFIYAIKDTFEPRKSVKPISKSTIRTIMFLMDGK